MNEKKTRLIEVGFRFQGGPYIFRAFEPSPLGVYCEPGSPFKGLGRAELAVIPCTIERADNPGKVEAHWNRLELRLLDPAPDGLFSLQPSSGAEQEDLFNRLLITCEEAIKEAISQARAARSPKQETIPAHRKHLS